MKIQSRHFAVIVLAAVLVMACQLILPGYYYKINEHAAMLPKFILQFKAALLQGDLYPRWMAEDFSGYGSPTFVFYSPLLFLLAALLNIAGLSVPLAVSFLDLAGLCIGGFFLYLFIKDRFGARAALFAALLYVLLPNRALDLYISNTPSGRLGAAFIPMLIYYTHRHASESFSVRNLSLMAASYALFIMTHIASAYIFTPFVAAYGILAVRDARYTKRAIKTVAGLSAGLCLSAVFLLPAIAEKRFVHIEYFSQAPDYSFWKNFVFSSSHHNVADFQKLIDLTRNAVMVEVALLAIVIYLAARYAKDALDGRLRFFIISLAVCIFMMTSASGFLWGHVPGLSTVAFPSRFVPVYIFFFSVIAGVTVNALPGSRLRPGFSAAAVALTAFTLMTYDAVIIYRSYPPIQEPYAVECSSSADLTEYLPRQVDMGAVEALKNDHPLIAQTGAGTVTFKRWDPTKRAFYVYSPNGTVITVKTFYFPGWKAWVDGNETSITTEGETGAIVIHLPPGRHEVSLKFTDTPIRVLGKAVSLVTLAMLVLLMFIPRQAPAPKA